MSQVAQLSQLKRRRLRGLIYARISKDKPDAFGAHESTDLQIGNCEEKVDEDGDVDIVAVLQDDDVSASIYNRKGPREGYLKALKMIERNEIDVVYTWHTDRLWRQPRELETYIDGVGAHGVLTRTVTAGRLELSTAAGRKQARQFVNDAAYESEHRSERVKVATANGAKKGKHHGGRRCFGYEGGPMRLGDEQIGITDPKTGKQSTMHKPIGGGYSMVPAEALEVVKMLDAVIAGESLRTIARDLNARGVPRVSCATPWRAQDVGTLLLAPRIAGYSTHRGVIVGDGLWDRLVDREKWHTARAYLLDPKRLNLNHSQSKKGTGAAPKYLGSGIYLCAACGQGMFVSLAKQKPTYRCHKQYPIINGQTHVARQCADLDNYVRDAILEVLKTMDVQYVTPVTGTPADAARLRIKQAEVEPLIRQVIADRMAKKISASESMQRQEEIYANAEQYEADLAMMPEFDPAEDLVRNAERIDRGWWDDVLDLDQRRSLIRRYAEVVVKPLPRGSKGFNLDGVAITWRKRRAKIPTS